MSAQNGAVQAAPGFLLCPMDSPIVFAYIIFSRLFQVYRIVWRIILKPISLFAFLLYFISQEGMGLVQMHLS